MPLRPKVSVIMMICNEEYWIELVLCPILNLGLPLYIADCASTDNTPRIIQALCDQYYPFYVKRYDYISPTENGMVKAELSQQAQTPWVLQVDGDEIWLQDKLETVLNTEIDDSIASGFVHVQNVLWEGGRFVLADGISQHRLHRRDAKWHGEYPFESTDDFSAEQVIYFLNGPHAYHTRYLIRSSHDAMTYMRLEKLQYFDPRERAIYQPIDLFAEVGQPTLISNPYLEKTS